MIRATRLRPPSETPLGNAGPQVTHVSGKIDDLCARLSPPSETPLRSNAGPQVTHVSGKIDDSCTRLMSAVGDATQQRRPTGDTCVRQNRMVGAQGPGLRDVVDDRKDEYRIYGDACCISAHGAGPTDDGRSRGI